MKSLLTIAAAVLVAAPAQAGPYLRHYKGINAALMCIEKQEFNERMLKRFELQDLQMKRTLARQTLEINEMRAGLGLPPIAPMTAQSIVETQRERQQLDWVQSNCHNVMAEAEEMLRKRQERKERRASQPSTITRNR